MTNDKNEKGIATPKRTKVKRTKVERTKVKRTKVKRTTLTGQKKTPYSIQKQRVVKSPFRSTQKVKEALQKYKKGNSIGFTYVSSLKAMGLLPRSNGNYEISKKYQ
jgi:hypothetical protein